MRIFLFFTKIKILLIDLLRFKMKQEYNESTENDIDKFEIIYLFVISVILYTIFRFTDNPIGYVSVSLVMNSIFTIFQYEFKYVKFRFLTYLLISIIGILSYIGMLILYSIYLYMDKRVLYEYFL